MDRRRKPEDIRIGPDMPGHLRFLLAVPPVPSGADARCSGSGVCATLAWSGVSCGALFSKCALLPLVKREVVDGKGAVVANEFEGFLNGVRMRHPEFFNVMAENVPAPAPKQAPAPKITPLPLNVKPDWQMKAAGDDGWDGEEPEVIDGN